MQNASISAIEPWCPKAKILEVFKWQVKTALLFQAPFDFLLPYLLRQIPYIIMIFAIKTYTYEYPVVARQGYIRLFKVFEIRS